MNLSHLLPKTFKQGPWLPLPGNATRNETYLEKSPKKVIYKAIRCGGRGQSVSRKTYLAPVSCWRSCPSRLASDPHPRTTLLGWFPALAGLSSLTTRIAAYPRSGQPFLRHQKGHFCEGTSPTPPLARNPHSRRRLPAAAKEPHQLFTTLDVSSTKSCCSEDALWGRSFGPAASPGPPLASCQPGPGRGREVGTGGQAPALQAPRPSRAARAGSRHRRPRPPRPPIPAPAQRTRHRGGPAPIPTPARRPDPGPAPLPRPPTLAGPTAHQDGRARARARG